MNVTELNRSGLNMSRLNASLLNVGGMGCMGCKGKETMEDRIMQSMVLWYDLAKQGATNESMAADPRIIDHSGNGHDATCYNFAWSEMSGIGGYSYDFMNWTLNEGLFVMERTSTSVHVDGRNEGVTTATFLEKYLKISEDTGTFTFPSLKIRVQNPNGFPICSDYWYNELSTDVFDLSESGTYTIPERTYEVDESMSNKNIALRFRIDTAKADAGTDYSNMNVTIELLPEYPGALVYDGVDDKCNSQPFQMDNFAVFIDLDFISNEQNHSTGIYKPNNFYVYYRKYNTLNIFLNGNNTTNVLQRNDIFYLDSQGLVVFKDGTTDNIPTENHEEHVSTNLAFNGANNGYIQFAFRRMLLFNRVLTLEEIEWVRTNLMSE